MIDLLGFWVSVTICTYLLLCIPFGIAMMVGVAFVSVSSRGRINLDKKSEELYQKYFFQNEALLGVITSVMLLLWLFYLIARAISYHSDLQLPSILEIVDVISTFLSTFVGWISAVSLMFCVLITLSRKIFDIYFVVKDKLSTLEK